MTVNLICKIPSNILGTYRTEILTMEKATPDELKLIHGKKITNAKAVTITANQIALRAKKYGSYSAEDILNFIRTMKVKATDGGKTAKKQLFWSTGEAISQRFWGILNGRRDAGCTDSIDIAFSTMVDFLSGGWDDIVGEHTKIRTDYRAMIIANPSKADAKHMTSHQGGWGSDKEKRYNYSNPRLIPYANESGFTIETEASVVALEKAKGKAVTLPITEPTPTMSEVLASDSDTPPTDTPPTS